MCHLCDTTPAVRPSRRAFLHSAAGAALAAFAPSLAWAAASPKAISPAEALKRLLDGNARYVANRPSERDFSLVRTRGQRQPPAAAILSCADARVAPEFAFDQGPGDIFTVRVVGNFASEEGLASIEFAVKYRSVPLVMVLGHSSCGAIETALHAVKNKEKLPGRLSDLVKWIKPAITRAEKERRGRDLLTDAIAENVRLNVARLQSTGPILKPLVADGRVDVVGATYDYATGRVALV